MASTLRLPPELDADARERCQRLGISLNALVCVALDAYLRHPPVLAAEPATPTAPGLAGSSQAAATAPAPATGAPGAQLSRKERRMLEALQRGGTR